MTKKLEKWMIPALAVLVVIIIGISIAIAVLGKDKDTLGTENTAGTEELVTEEVFETEITEETEMEVVQTVSISMTATSFEKDLKIKIVDEKKKLVSGQPFVIVVTPEGTTEGKEYNDHDMDGIIYIKSLNHGKYQVMIQEMDGFIPVANVITATVKDKIVYEKVEIKDEIKDESEIDSSKEDTTAKPEDVENVIQDTLPLLQTNVETDEIDKERVDFANFADASVSDEKVSVLVAGVEVSLPKVATLYMHGKESSKVISFALNGENLTSAISDVRWTIDGADTSIVDMVVASDKHSIKLTAKAVGEVVIIASMRDAQSGEEKTVSAKVLIMEQTSTSPLKDMEGNKLYLDADAKQVATVKDYATAETFYVNPRYTGWQTIDGKVYYYKEDHTFATGKQVISGVTYEFDETGYLITKDQMVGIDVSKWNGDIDWKTVAESGIDFAIIRCGYRGTSTGVLVEDPYFKQNIKGATENGIKIGVYFYSQAITEAEAIEEASMALELVKGYHLQFPIYIDTEESGGRADKLSAEERTACVKAFCETIKNAGYKAGIYSGKWWYMNKLNTSELEKYHIWVAQYNTECNYPGRFDIWQHTDSGKVPGINGKVDMNISYRVYY